MPQMITFSLQEIVAISSIFFGGGGILTFVLKSKGLITFGKPVERRAFTICDAHSGMHEDIKDLVTEFQELRKTVEEINLKFAEHMGYHSGANS